jgi:hypothetical protein
MKVLNLRCSQQHSFEGWFASEEDFQGQLTRGLVSCPLCADPTIRKMPSAPRLNLGVAVQEGAQSEGELPAPAAAPASGPAHQVMAPASSPAAQAGFLKALRHVMANTEDVGARFADEARAMHYGDAEQRNIRGQASTREAVELLEEGIAVMPLALPAAVKETLQ